MKIVNRIFDFLVYSNTIIGLAAVGLVFTMAHVSQNLSVDRMVLLFVFSLIVCLYGWLKYKESWEENLPITTHRQWFFANMSVAISWVALHGFLVLVLSYQVSKQHQFAIGALTFFSVFYVFDFKYSIRRFALVKPFYVALIWAMMVVLMAFDVTMQFSVDLFFVAVAVFLLLSILLLLFEIKDREIDKANKLITWPIRLGIERTKYLAYVLSLVLLLSSLFSCFAFENLLPLSIAFALQSFALILIIKFTTSNSKEHWYFVAVDGSLLLLPLFYFLIA